MPSLRFDFGHLEDDDDEDGFQGFTAVREACLHGDGQILERLSPDPALDDFDDLYLAASSPEVIRALAHRALPPNVGSIIYRRLAWGTFDRGWERWRTIDVLRCVFEVGGRWHSATKDSIAAVRHVLIRVPDSTLIDVMKLLTTDDHCAPEILKELARTPAIRRRIKEVGFMPPDPEEATRRFRRPPPPPPTRSREVLKKLGVEIKAPARPLPPTLRIGRSKPGRQAVPLDRQALFERVWSDPITTVAREWGISDQGLRKVCKKIQVPVPPRGYWARTRVGQRVRRPRLPALPAGQAEEIVVWVAE